MVTSINLIIFLSEALLYKLKLEAMNHQGRTSGQVGQKWSRDEIAEGESGRQVQRYIRLNEVIADEGIREKCDVRATAAAFG